jgi:hypothetical protein
MAALKATTVSRGGVTSKRWYEHINSVSINPSTGVQIRFSMSSKGGGYTDVSVEIRPEDFPTLLETMSLVNREAAMQAMAIELSRQVSTQPERDQKAISLAKSQAAQDIQDRAWSKYFGEPLGQDERGRIVKEGVSEIIGELNLRGP